MSCLKVAAEESCWMEACRSRKSDLDSESIRVRWGLVRVRAVVVGRREGAVERYGWRIERR